MINALIIVALFSPDASLAAALTDGDGDEAPGLCTTTRSLTKGVLAPCTGVLWSIPQTRQALICKKADLPKCKNNLQLCRDLYDGQESASAVLLHNCNSLVVEYRRLLDEATPFVRADPWYRSTAFIAILTATAFAGGAYVGGVIF